MINVWVIGSINRDTVTPLLVGGIGSIQNTTESKRGYTSLRDADRDHDGLLVLAANTLWGKVIWCRSVGSAQEPELASAQPARANMLDKPLSKTPWNGWGPDEDELGTRWRTTPVVVDWTGNRLHDPLMLDHECYLALHQRIQEASGQLSLMPDKRLFRLNTHSLNTRLETTLCN